MNPHNQAVVASFCMGVQADFDGSHPSPSPPPFTKVVGGQFVWLGFLGCLTDSWTKPLGKGCLFLYAGSGWLRRIARGFSTTPTTHPHTPQKVLEAMIVFL